MYLRSIQWFLRYPANYLTNWYWKMSWVLQVISVTWVQECTSCLSFMTLLIKKHQIYLAQLKPGTNPKHSHLQEDLISIVVLRLPAHITDWATGVWQQGYQRPHVSYPHLHHR